MGTSAQPSANTERRHERLVTELRTIVRALLSSTIQASFRQARDPGFREINAGYEPQIRTNTLDAFAAASEELSAAYLDEIGDQFRTDNTGEHDLGIEERGLGNADELEINIALKRLCAHVRLEHREALDQVETGLQALSTHQPAGPSRLALHPESLISTFHLQIEPIAATVAGKILLCELFAEQLSARLEDLYSRAQRILSEGGMLDKPDAPVSESSAIIDHPAADRATNTEIKNLRTGEFLAPIAAHEWVEPQATTHEPAADHAAPRHIESSSPIDTEVNDLIGEYLSPTPDSDPSRSSRPEVIAALTVASRAPGAANAPLTANEITTLIRERMARDEQGRVPTIDADDVRIIALVCEIYRASLRENVVIGHMAGLLTRLQLPVAKLALLDKGFIQNPHHPGRELLNELVSLGVGVSDRNEPLSAYLHHVVSYVVDGFDTDIAVFQDALKRVRKISVVANKSPRRAESDSGARARESARRSGAKRMVVATMHRYIRNKRVPAEPLDFILKCWAPFMALTYYNHGADSQTWRSSVQTLRRLIEGARSDLSKKDFRRLIGDPKELFNEITVELERIAFRSETDPASLLARAYGWYERAALLARPSHRQAPRLPVDEDEYSFEAHLHTEDLWDDAGVQEDDSEDLLSMLLACVPAEVRPGAWFEIFRGKGSTKRRLKISSIREDTGHVLFADHSGKVILHVHLETFLQDIRTGRSKLINDSNLFDRALASFIRSSNLRRDGGA